MLDAQDTMLRGTDGFVLASAAPEVGVAATTTMGVGPVPIPEVAKTTETGYMCGFGNDKERFIIHVKITRCY